MPCSHLCADTDSGGLCANTARLLPIPDESIQLREALLPCCLAWLVAQLYKAISSSTAASHFILNRYLLLATSIGAACASVVAMHMILSYLESAWPDLVASTHWLILGAIFLLSEWVGVGYILMILGLVSVLLFKLTASPLMGIEYSVGPKQPLRTAGLHTYIKSMDLTARVCGAGRDLGDDAVLLALDPWHLRSGLGA